MLGLNQEVITNVGGEFVLVSFVDSKSCGHRDVLHSWSSHFSLRYLWPMIHYHKFLAKCIKKLKRHGVDVKHCVTPVCVFLRDEVCAVSDHLASVSLFSSEEWMDCLEHFSGWAVMTDEAEIAYRKFVAQLPLRSIDEPGDVNSPLLRSQIDENFLRTMIAQREQLRESNVSTTQPSSVASTDAQAEPSGQHHKSARNSAVPRHIQSHRRPRFLGFWNGACWEHAPPPPGAFGDNSSVQSGLSMDSMHPSSGDPCVVPVQPYTYMQPTCIGYEACMYDASLMYGYPFVAPVEVPMIEGYYPPPGFYGHPMMAADPNMATHMGHDDMYNNAHYWSHLDQGTMSMGVATPSKANPTTPRRKNDDKNGTYVAPYSRQHYYNPYIYAAPESCGPLSPATQFMMSSQSEMKPCETEVAVPKGPQRQGSLSTVETTAETDSIPDGAS